MTSLGRGIGLGLVVVAATQVGASAASQHHAAAKAPRHAAVTEKTVPAPEALSDRIDALGSAFDGQVGIAVKSER